MILQGDSVQVSDGGEDGNFSGVGIVRDNVRQGTEIAYYVVEGRWIDGQGPFKFEFEESRVSPLIADSTFDIADLTSKPTNPKDAIGSDKLPLHLWPETASATGCLGLLEGALKYGRSNWRETGVRASIYVDALRRHVAAWFEGEDDDPDSGMPHLGHALACLAIIIDAQAAGRLNDDRAYPGGYRQLVEDLTPLVKTAKANHADKDPKHWTIADA